MTCLTLVDTELVSSGTLPGVGRTAATHWSHTVTFERLALVKLRSGVDRRGSTRVAEVDPTRTESVFDPGLGVRKASRGQVDPLPFPTYSSVGPEIEVRGRASEDADGYLHLRCWSRQLWLFDAKHIAVS